MSASDVAAVALQTLFVLAVGMALPGLVGLRLPAARLRFWQVLLGLLLFLPVIPVLAVPTATGPLTGRGSLVVEVVAGAVSTEVAGAGAGWLPLLLTVVAAALLARLVFGFWALRRWRREARRLDPVPEPIRSAAELVGTSASMRVSSRVRVPVTFGWLRPVVLLPESFLRLPAEAQQALAVHELVHVRRRHWPVAVVEELLRAVLWFHPGVRILLGRIALAREQVVDADVVLATGRRRDYLEGLWSMAGGAAVVSPVPSIALLERGHLRERVVALTREVSMSRLHLVAATLVAAVALGAAVVSAAAAFPAATSSTAPAATLGSDPAVRFESGGPISEPKAVHKVQPKYPEEARKQGLMGVVVVDAEISAEGRIVDMKVLSADDDVFVQPTFDALSQWRFEPATLDGKPVAVYYSLTIRYRLSDKKE